VKSKGSLPCSQQRACPYPELMNTVHTLPSYLRSSVMFSSYLSPGLQRQCLLSGFPAQIIWAFAFSHARYMPHPMSLLYLIISTLHGEYYTTRISTLCNFTPAKLRTNTLVIIKDNNNPQKEKEQSSLRPKHRLLWMASLTIKERLKLKLGRNILHPCISVLDTSGSGSTCTFLYVRLHKGCTFNPERVCVTLNHGTPIPLALWRCSLHLVIKMKGA